MVSDFFQPFIGEICTRHGDVSSEFSDRSESCFGLISW